MSIPTHKCCFCFKNIYFRKVHDFTTCKTIKMERILIRYLMRDNVAEKSIAEEEVEEARVWENVISIQCHLQYIQLNVATMEPF